MARLPLKAWRNILAFVAVIVLGYALAFHWIENRRIARGPWIVDFGYEGVAARLTVNQPSEGITNVQIQIISGAIWTNVPAEVRFVTARNVPFEVPFGQCVFQDILFLPGTVALRVGGHEVQLMPRCLTIDKVEHPWRSGTVIRVE